MRVTETDRDRGKRYLELEKAWDFMTDTIYYLSFKGGDSECHWRGRVR